MRPSVDHKWWLEHGLHWLLVAWYAGVVHGLVTLVITWPTRPLTALDELPWWSVLPTLLLLALTYRPLVGELGPSVHQLVYGRHDDAYALMARVHEQLYALPSPYPLLPALAATVADTLRLPFVAIEPLHVEHLSAPSPTATYGAAPDEAERVTIPLRYHAHTLGTLTVSARRRHERLSADDRRLLHDLARQVSITLYATQLSEALQASREQLVLAREEERRRLRRDLHDGLGPTLAAIHLQLAALRRSLHQSTDTAEQLITDLQADVAGATGEIRRIVYNLRPPMLDEFGLLGALRHLNPGSDTLSVQLVAPNALPPLPAAAEVALYRIASEALHNVARHGHARRCTITLELHEAQIVLSVSDDGCGLPANYQPGVGHQAMQERAAELGGSVAIELLPRGGTQVTARFPWRGATDG
jgi:signal transduction histidine kinase